MATPTGPYTRFALKLIVAIAVDVLAVRRFRLPGPVLRIVR
jgi:hypothetical protein